MKKRKIVIILIVIICLITVLGGIAFCQKQKVNMFEQERTAIYYRQQNRTLPLVAGNHPTWVEYYVDYDEVDESKLYVCLAAYNEYIELHDMDTKKLTLEHMKEYLASEYDEDGSLRICKKYKLTWEEFLTGEYNIEITPWYDTYKYVQYENYPHIYEYVNWYYTKDGETAITEYWGDLEDIIIEYKGQNPELELCNAKEMNISQLQELINKKNNPSYEINMDVMRGSN